MSRQIATYFRGLWQALRGRSGLMPVAADGMPEATLRARIAGLELDLRERDERLEQVKKEYGALQVERDRATAGAGQEQTERLLRRLCGPLSNLVMLAEANRAGKDVLVTDMAQLVADLEKQLATAGLERIGAAGEQTPFDVAVHQRMSGGAVRPGGTVTVRIPGYRLSDKILQKAMVTAKEE
ncbi:MAG: nucleotide exchange factor GrpE [Phycisphaerae bacterium]|nr:nucleotide exchange factor GrpE [Phycisphaerae bacterium]